MQNLREQPFTRRSLILPIYFPAFLLSVGGGILIPIFPEYAKSFNPSYSLMGLVLGMQGVGVLITDVPAGILIERTGPQIVNVNRSRCGGVINPRRRICPHCL